jgi:hypothetical protein
VFSQLDTPEAVDQLGVAGHGGPVSS